jgi:hypothetical protein
MPVDRTKDRTGAVATFQRNRAAGVWRPTDVSDEKRLGTPSPTAASTQAQGREAAASGAARRHPSIQRGSTSSFDAWPAVCRLNKAAVNGPSFFACHACAERITESGAHMPFPLFRF